MNDLETVLSEVGLSEKESSVYLALLQLGRSSVTPISARSGVKRTSIYNFIDRLVALGLVEKTEERGRTLFHALPP
ncbi:MAG: helix-turn-helix domain-containing protein, partial [Bdellovibrionales bacterium]|nr:helix-turn-helix domain-containing protein [Bdellovibrionales bacterium]